MDSLNQLIERLQHLHLEQGRILQALENIAAAETELEEPVVGRAIVVLKRNTTTTVIASTIQANERATVSAVPFAASVPVVTAGFYIGQRVYITNRITHVLVRRATEADRTAIVTHFTASRVGIRTINGYQTHRHPKNLRQL